jgi:hypothetical protein
VQATPLIAPGLRTLQHDTRRSRMSGPRDHGLAVQRRVAACRRARRGLRAEPRAPFERKARAGDSTVWIIPPKRSEETQTAIPPAKGGYQESDPIAFVPLGASYGADFRDAIAGARRSTRSRTRGGITPRQERRCRLLSNLNNQVSQTR